MSYIKVFNDLVDEFFCDLILVFPEESGIKVCYSLFQTICKVNAKKTSIDFMMNSIPYLEKVCMKDETFFTNSKEIKLFDKLNLSKLWTPELSQTTKNAIWKYIKSFYAVGIKIVEMPPETLPLINFIINSE